VWWGQLVFRFILGWAFVPFSMSCMGMEKSKKLPPITLPPDDNFWNSPDLYYKCCGLCNKYHRSATPRHGELQDMRVGTPMERLHLNIIGLHVRNEREGMTYIMYVCVSCK